MASSEWRALLDASADPSRARHHLGLLKAACGETALEALPADAREVLAVLLAGSSALAALLVRHPDWLNLLMDAESLGRPRRREGLRREVAELLAQARSANLTSPALSGLRELHLREMLRIGIRDLARLGTLPDLLLELSNAADAFLDGVLSIVRAEATARFGEPWHTAPDGAWVPTAFCVLGMGKLGGQELNYSSDVDLLFVYTDEGGTYRKPPRKKAAGSPVLASHQFFKRICEALIREATAHGVEGGGLRIDMRLRPEGDSGPLARSLDSYENFYAEWGQTWERMMLLKARCVAGDQDLAGEFLDVVQPFRYPRSLGAGIFREMSQMKARIEADVVRAGELERNVKLGRGGIREIEFVVQSLQVLHGGRNPFLQTPQTLAALPKLVSYDLLKASDAGALLAAYPFLRDVEHRLQMDELRQTHTLPDSRPVRERIARLMGQRDAEAFSKELSRHARNVRAVYDRVVGEAGVTTVESALPGDFTVEAQAWRDLLVARRFRDPEHCLRIIRAFVEGPGFVHVARRTSELGRQLVERLIELCPGGRSSRTAGAGGADFVLSDPDRVLARLDSYVAAYGTRASLYELWAARPNVFEHFLRLFDRSEFLAELAIRVPDLVDDLEAGGYIGRQKDASLTLEELRRGIDDEDQHLWLRRYFQTEFMRLGLRDVLGLVDFEGANAELSALAEACLEYAVEVMSRRHRLRTAPFAVVALGKFGGAELVYGSDLDVVFVAPDRTRNLPRLQKLAGEVIELLSARTEHGSVFVLDARLRPDGEKGLLVNERGAFEEYYRQRAMLWEIQALTRARHVAGDVEAGSALVSTAVALTDFRKASGPLAARTPDWKPEIARMRLRIERERTPMGMDHLAFKTGSGGLIDAEFIAQALAMEHGWFEPNTLKSLRLAREHGVLEEADADSLIENFRRLRRMESILRRWSFEGEAVLPDDPAPQYRVAVRCGYPDAASFFKSLAQWRAAVRAVYGKVFQPAGRHDSSLKE